MGEPERDYSLRRAEAELKMAEDAGSIEAVNAHYALAGLYLDRAYGGTAPFGAVEALLRKP